MCSCPVAQCSRYRLTATQSRPIPLAQALQHPSLYSSLPPTRNPLSPRLRVGWLGKGVGWLQLLHTCSPTYSVAHGGRPLTLSTQGVLPSSYVQKHDPSSQSTKPSHQLLTVGLSHHYASHGGKSNSLSTLFMLPHNLTSASLSSKTSPPPPPPPPLTPLFMGEISTASHCQVVTPPTPSTPTWVQRSSTNFGSNDS